MARGRVKWFDDKKGYGFLRDEKGGKDIFVHHSSIKMKGFRTLQAGELVEYEIELGPKGPEARDVVRIPQE